MVAKKQVISIFDEFEFLDDSKSWDLMYKARKKSSPTVEWYVSWDDLKPHLMPILEGLRDGEPRILVPACGDSKLSEEVYLSGIHNITNVDYSTQLINLMNNKHKDKGGMQWLPKDILAPLEDPPTIRPRSYDLIIDKGCFDFLCVWADNESDKIGHQYLLRVKELLRDKGKFICLTRLYLDDSIAFFCRRFWLGWKVKVQKVFPQKDDERAVMLVIERCSLDGLVPDIVQVDKTLSLEVKKENKLRDKYRTRAKSKEDFEHYLRDQAGTCCEVDHILPERDADYRVIVLTNDKIHDLKMVDVLWVPEDHLVLGSDALTNSNHWQLQHFLSTMCEESKFLLMALSPKLQLHLQSSDMLMDKIFLDLKPLLDIIDPKIQVGWLKMWSEEHENKLKEIGFLPQPPSPKPTPQISRPTPQSSRPPAQSSRPAPQSSRPPAQSSRPAPQSSRPPGSQSWSSKKEIDTFKGKAKLEKDDDNSGGGKEGNDDTIVLGVRDLDMVEVVVEKTKEKVAHLKTSPRPYDFPTFYDGDEIPYYSSETFTFSSWLHDHEAKEDRWLLGEYVQWEDILPEVECPNLLKRESMRIMQSIIIGVIDYHEAYGAHGGLDDWTNIMITQVVFNHNGSKLVRFESKLSIHQGVEATVFDDESLMISKKQDDMRNVLEILEKVLEGGDKNSELQYLGDLLFHYPYEKENMWKNLLLKNYPALWDGLERAEFLVNLHFHLVSDVRIGNDLKWAIHSFDDESNQQLDWMSHIPQGTIFEKVLYGDDLNKKQSSIGVESGSSTSQNVKAKKHYDKGMDEAVRYMRATVHHFRQRGGHDLDVRYIEAALSQILEKYIVRIYSNMCEAGCFL